MSPPAAWPRLLAGGVAAGLYGAGAVLATACVVVPAFAFSGVWRLQFVLSGALLAYVVVRLLVGRPSAPLPGIVLGREEAPRLHALIAEVAGPRLWLIDEVRLAPTAIASSVRRDGRTVLVLGLPYVGALDREALAATVAHQLSHVEYDLTRSHRALSRVRRTLADGAYNGSAIGAPLRRYARLVERAAAAIRADAERRADIAAIAAAGPDAVHRAGAADRAVALVWPAFYADSVVPALDSGLRPPLARDFRRRLARVPVDARGGVAPWPAGGDDALIREITALEPALLASVAGEERGSSVRAAGYEELAAARAAAPPARGRDTAALGRLAFRYCLATETAGRVWAAVGLVFLLAVTVPIAGMLSYWALMLSGGEPLGDRLVALVTAVASVAMLHFFGWRWLRLLRPAGHVAAGDGRLVIEHRSLLNEPLDIALASVRAVAICEERPELRFPVFPRSVWEGDGPVGYVWGADHGGELPVLDVVGGPPNVAIVLDAPVAPPLLRHRVGHGPRPDEPLKGVLLCVDRPHELGRHLAATGLLRALRVDDL
ncbi:MAG: hypothetical protein AVDCRST_MAG85-4172 [uncultured Solirubrobacteraceae bacterium]|uniref:Peptidase M48 domain-containing protein n=1 Tax=uncultured Solirubrobacteraceae bacterium TaxID=1162706 RepID=A0A6J4TZA4_9ACTN|nr:MAG: hypothetical protein AVDCRST_MAG85-4172 [uncultured Solirubrobacteraceae bacterium]